VLIDKISMERIKSIIIGCCCCKPIMQYQQEGLLVTKMGDVYLALQQGILYYSSNNPIVEHVTKNLVFGLRVLCSMLNVVVEIAYQVLHVSIKGGKAKFFQDAHIPYDCHEIISTMIQTHNSHNSIINHLLFHPTLIGGNPLNALGMSSLWLPRSCSDYANSPWNKIVQSIRARYFVPRYINSNLLDKDICLDILIDSLENHCVAVLAPWQGLTHTSISHEHPKYLKTFYNLEDKVCLHGVDSDIIYVVWVPCLLAWMCHNES
jgi:hypothetical protein